MADHHCPKCAKPLEWVGRGPDWMNSEQWDASKAGDYFAPCADASHPNGNCYFRESDLTAPAPAAKPVQSTMLEALVACEKAMREDHPGDDSYWAAHKLAEEAIALAGGQS
jgi:hypothetical protein